MTESQQILSLETVKKQAILAFVLTIFNFVAIAFINHGFDHTAMIMEKAVLVEVIFIFTHFFLLIRLLFGIEKYFDRKFAEKSDALVRYTLELLYFLAACGILFTLVFLLPVSAIHYLAYGMQSLQIPGTVVREFYIIDMVFAFILYAAKVGLVTYAKLQEVSMEADRLERENAHEAFETLKNNINPNFLFGSLHTLSEQIHHDKDSACRLVNELSDVYRYVLDNKDRELVSLEKEITYIQLYADLLMAQHPGKLHITVDVDKPNLRHSLPPLLLQFLLDQAIEQINKEESQPLHIKIAASQNEFLEVKCTGFSENGTWTSYQTQAWKRLISKYKHLSIPQIEHKEEEGVYLVKIQLLELV